MTEYRVDHVFRNERHDLDRVTGIVPRKGKPARKITLRDELADGRGFFRSDVILVNAYVQHCPTCACTESLVQFSLDVSRSGELTGDREAFALISEDDLAWAKAEAELMIATACESEAYALAFLR